jgi:hypothetical protein
MTASSDQAVAELAQKIIGKSSVAVSIGKRMFYKHLEMGLEGAISTRPR